MSFDRKRRSGEGDFIRQNKRPRLPPILELSKSLCGDLNTLGESTKRYVEDVEFMMVPIETNFENESTFQKAVLETLYAITIEQPHKILHIAGLVQAVHSKNAKIGRIIMEYFHQQAKVLLDAAVSEEGEVSSNDTGPWNKLGLVLRFLAAVPHVVEQLSVVAVFKQFLQLAVDLQSSTPDKRNPLGEAIYYNTLISIPYFFTYKRDNQGDSLETSVKELLELARGFNIVETNLDITGPFTGAELPIQQQNLVSLILPALDQCLTTREMTELFPDISSQLVGYLVEEEKHALPPFSMPTVEALAPFQGLDKGLGSVDGMWRVPRKTFQVYLPVDGVHSTPPPTTYAGLLLRDMITNVCEALEFNRKEVARQIITMDLFFQETFFAPPGTHIDKLKLIENGSTFKIETTAVETVLGLIFNLPTCSQPSIYFYTTLVEACVNSSQAIAPVLGKAIRFFYYHVTTLDYELRLRYLDWLSVQLSNFNFSWKWHEWEADVEVFQNSVYHPRGVFIKNIIAKELRLATRERIETTLAEAFYPFLDISLFDEEESTKFQQSIIPDLEPESESTLVYLNDNFPYKSTVEKLIEAIYKGTEKFDEVVDELRSELSSYENSERVLITIMFQVITFVGNRSMSHASKYISTTSASLKKLVGIVDKSGDTEMEEGESTTTEEQLEKQLWAIDAVLHFWNKDPYNGYLVVDMLEVNGIVSATAIIQHTLDDSRKKNLGLVNICATETIVKLITKRLYSKSGSKELTQIWEILVAIIGKTVGEIGVDAALEIPGADETVTEQVEKIWKYHTVLSFMKMCLRKFSDEYVTMDLTTKLKESVNHEPTLEVVGKWIEELSCL